MATSPLPLPPQVRSATFPEISEFPLQKKTSRLSLPWKKTENNALYAPTRLSLFLNVTFRMHTSLALEDRTSGESQMVAICTVNLLSADHIFFFIFSFILSNVARSYIWRTGVLFLVNAVWRERNKNRYFCLSRNENDSVHLLFMITESYTK